MPDDDGGRLIPFPAVGMRPLIGGDGETGGGPDSDPTDRSTGPQFPVVDGARLTPPPSVLLPHLVDSYDGEQAQPGPGEGRERLTSVEVASLGLLIASAIAVAAVRGTVALANWVRARAEHYRAVREKARTASGSGGRVPSSVEYGRKALGAGRAGAGSGGGGGRSSQSTVPAAFRSGRGSARPNGNRQDSKGPSPAGDGPGKRKRHKSGSDRPGWEKDGGRVKAPRGAKPPKPGKGSMAGMAGGSSSASGSHKDRKHPKKVKQTSGNPRWTGSKKSRRHRRKSSPTIAAAARRARRHVLRKVRKTAYRATAAVGRSTWRGTTKAARRSRTWARIGWVRITARAEARWLRRRAAASGPSDPPGSPAADSSVPPGPDAGTDPGGGAGGPRVGGRRPKPPPAWTDPYTVTLERLDEQPCEPTVAAAAIAPSRAALPASASQKESHPVSTPLSASHAAPVRAESVQFAVDTDLTIHDLVESDDEVAEEILAQADVAQQDAHAAEALISRLEELQAALANLKVPGRLLGFVARLIDQAGEVRANAQALAQALPDASTAIKQAGQNAAARHMPLADAVRDAGHNAPAERPYHHE